MEQKRQERYDAWAQFIEARETAVEPFEQRLQSDEFKALPQEERDAEIKTFQDAESAFRAESGQRKAELAEMDANIDLQRAEQKRRDDAADASKGTRATVTSEPLTYRSDNTRGDEGLSWYRDLAMVEIGVTTQTGGTKDHARARLEQHAREMQVEMPKRAKAREERAKQQVAAAEAEFLARMNVRMQDPKVDRLLAEMRNNGLQFNPFEQRVTPNSTDGYGGYFIPPVWLEDEFIPGLRAHLIAAGLPRQMDVPPGTNSINIPKLSALTTVGYQQANNAGLPSQDWTDTFVNANVKTIGGYSDVAIQLLEQSPHGIVDEVITTDLMAAYNTFLDQQVIAGDGVSVNQLNGGHILGLYPYTNWSANNVTWTASTPAPYKHAEMFGAMASQIARTRFDATNYRMVLHGRRWFFYSTGLDANNRPLGETPGGGRYNIAAAVQNGLQAEGLVGSLPFLADAPVYIDDNIGTADTTGGGTLQDYAISGLWDDAWLFKTPLRTEVFREVLSGSLGVRFRIYNYAAFLVRYGQSFSVATGSGFSAPVGVSASSLVF
jgi:HK97 family phage major capsid protein